VAVEIPSFRNKARPLRINQAGNRRRQTGAPRAASFLGALVTRTAQHVYQRPTRPCPYRAAERSGSGAPPTCWRARSAPGLDFADASSGRSNRTIVGPGHSLATSDGCGPRRGSRLLVGARCPRISFSAASFSGHSAQQMVAGTGRKILPVEALNHPHSAPSPRDRQHRRPRPTAR